MISPHFRSQLRRALNRRERYKRELSTQLRALLLKDPNVTGSQKAGLMSVERQNAERWTNVC